MGTILVYSLEIFLQVFNLMLICHLYQHVGCCLLQFADTLVLPKSNQNVHIELRTGTAGGSLLHALKPIVLQGLLRCKPLFRVNLKKLFDQIFYLI